MREICFDGYVKDRTCACSCVTYSFTKLVVLEPALKIVLEVKLALEVKLMITLLTVV